LSSEILVPLSSLTSDNLSFELCCCKRRGLIGSLVYIDIIFSLAVKAKGSVTVNSVPTFIFDVAAIVPPRAVVIFLLMAKPRPTPS
jgi:signal transduction histidine kinase